MKDLQQEYRALTVLLVHEDLFSKAKFANEYISQQQNKQKPSD